MIAEILSTDELKAYIKEVCQDEGICIDVHEHVNKDDLVIIKVD